MENKTFTFKKHTPITIDRYEFDFKGVNFSYEIQKGIFEKTQRKFYLLAIFINDDDLKKVLDKYHYHYLKEATNGIIYIDLKRLKSKDSFFLGHQAENYEQLENCESDKKAYKSFKHAVRNEVKQWIKK